MAARGPKKTSAFVAFNQLAENDADSGSSDDERAASQQQKEKQKQKKKARSKKKNSDSAALKDLAFVAGGAKSKKSKAKSKAATPAPSTPSPPRSTPAREAPSPVETRAREGGTGDGSGRADGQADKQEKAAPKATSKPPTTPKQVKAAAKPASPKRLVVQQNGSPASPAPVNGSGSDLGAVYSPSHIKITRTDGQMTRTVAVTEIMDQLLCFGQQNAHLLGVQEQMARANRGLQEQLQRDAEIIHGLQNEVAMFRQMCLNLQSEVTALRANGAAPHARPPPPPGMS